MWSYEIIFFPADIFIDCLDLFQLFYALAWTTVTVENLGISRTTNLLAVGGGYTLLSSTINLYVRNNSGDRRLDLILST